MFYAKKSSSSTVSVSFLLKVHQLGSGVQAGATKRRPTTHRERKGHNRSLWRRNEIVRADLNKKKYVVYVAMCSAADTVSGVLLEEARRDIKIFLPLFIYRALHLRRVWVEITACKLTTTCVRHWSQKIYNFPIVSVRFCATLQHLLSEKTSNRPLYVAYFS